MKSQEKFEISILSELMVKLSGFGLKKCKQSLIRGQTTPKVHKGQNYTSHMFFIIFQKVNQIYIRAK